MTDETPVFVFTTASSEAEADMIANVLVEEKLATAAGSMPGLKGVYRWKGEVHRSKEEWAMFMETTRDKMDFLVERVKEIHSFQEPCVLAFPVTAGSQDTLQWIYREIH
jgi:periplasmic divalent cation tolerance protein